MSKVRELTIAEIDLVSGGGHFGDVHDAQGVGTGSNNKGGARNTLGRNAPTHIYSDPSTVACANSAFGAFRSLPNIGRTAAREVGAIKQCMGGGAQEMATPQGRTIAGAELAVHVIATD
ncbi:hypothetical protein [Klebsiella quasipneumoniae]|uniref:hypothetical protein n=1 Tax=Klebsiella quasipneumoniae TaxID=1463165 RepID=UPI001D12B5B5|nr:hypothetical protein [Klebsiella quasipneumoniae]